MKSALLSQIGDRGRNGRDMRIIDIGVVVGQAHLVPYGDGQWLVNHRIDLRTFNDIY